MASKTPNKCIYYIYICSAKYLQQSHIVYIFTGDVYTAIAIYICVKFNKEIINAFADIMQIHTATY